MCITIRGIDRFWCRYFHRFVDLFNLFLNEPFHFIVENFMYVNERQSSSWYPLLIYENKISSRFFPSTWKTSLCPLASLGSEITRQVLSRISQFLPPISKKRASINVFLYKIRCSSFLPYRSSFFEGRCRKFIQVSSLFSLYLARQHFQPSTFWRVFSLSRTRRYRCNKFFI